MVGKKGSGIWDRESNGNMSNSPRLDINTTNWFNTIRSSYRLISKLCNAIMYEADDASVDHKIKGDQIFQCLGYDFARIDSDLPPKAEAIITLLPQTEEDNIENLLT